MNFASKTVVTQPQLASTKLSTMLRRARKLFYGVVSRDPRDIHLRELPDGTCEVICFPDEREMVRLTAKGLQRGVDGAVVIVSAANWIQLLGSNPTDD